SYNDRGSAAKASNTDQPFRVAFQSVALSGGRLVGVGRVAGYGASSISGSVIGGEKLTISADATLFKRGAIGSHQVQTGILVQPTLAQRIAVDYVNGGAAREDRVLIDPQDVSKGTRVFHTQTFDTTHQRSSDLDGSSAAFYLQDSWN